ncbi:MAG: bifunctional diaminohydroxyphosphoribosylaminopyrimidine deaminase/5-amino-6-(5-phosphoribosylamino)uracil reductase RibD [Spirochaetaceae bacterium]|nr:MAG: bifunctional diaminohydroxyphosphoribosylaminopyrimidine deaminase/5-amino-6-(5-phosphoribosylamino)uracil reductase RibD [Spirochaetaceae bacterium]
MSRALALARRGLGLTRPNPAVGALLVKDGRVIAEGWHRRAGSEHAEVAAIEAADQPLRGATLYCTLEPCCHDGPYKRTPPCTRRIISEGIGRVVVAALDPNPAVDGRGVAALREAGIEVTVGPLAMPALQLNEAFAAAVRLRRPFVHLKAAQTLDGYIATADGDSRWITDKQARTVAHELRAAGDAVVVGAATVRRDNPLLTVRHVAGRQPLRVVLSGCRPLPADSPLFHDRFADRTLVYQPEAGRTHVDLHALLDDLLRRDVQSVLVEGGSRVLSSFLARGLWDRLSLFVAPRILGGGVRTVDGLGIASIADAIALQEVSIERLGNGVLISGYRDPRQLFGSGFRHREVVGHAEAGAVPDALMEEGYVYGNC